MTRTAVLYRVHHPHRTYFAIRDPSSGRISTERNEHAIRAIAAESGLQVLGEQEITHAQWLHITGRGEPPSAEPSAGGSAGSPQPVQPAPGNTGNEQETPRAQGARAPAPADCFGDAIVINRPVPAIGCFADSPADDPAVAATPDPTGQVIYTPPLMLYEPPSADPYVRP